MIADLVRVVGGELVQVEGLMGPGIDPHLFKASEGDVASMSNAELVVYNGLHLEGKMVDIFEQMHSSGRAVHAVTDGLGDEDLLSSDYFAGSRDPHIWFDARLWSKAAEGVAGLLSELDPVHSEDYQARALAYQAQLDSLDAWARNELAGIKLESRVLITSHDAFGYFGRAYDLEVRGLQGLSTALEAGTADVRDLADFVAERRIPALFVESSISPRGIEAVREAVQSRGFDVLIGGTLYGDALGEAGSGADSFITMFRSNVETIRDGLSHTEE